MCLYQLGCNLIWLIRVRCHLVLCLHLSFGCLVILAASLSLSLSSFRSCPLSEPESVISNIIDHLRVGISTIAVIQCLHAPILMIRKNYFSDPQQRTIEPMCMYSTCVFSCCKANLTAVSSIILHLVYGEVCLLDQT